MIVNLDLIIFYGVLI